MDASAGGWLKVELLDEELNPVNGFTERDADFIWGNDICKTVTWNGMADLSVLKGKNLRLKFIGKNLKLYAFQFIAGNS